MPAYNCEATLLQTYQAIDRAVVDEVVLVDDASSDRSVEIAQTLPVHVLRHRRNRGYGGNQKTCYRYALSLGADVVVMLHPDYQYSPKLLAAMTSMISTGVYDCVLGSRILGVGQIASGMPRYKYIANRFLTAVQNLLTHHKLSEYHTGYRAFSRRVLETIPFERNSDDFIFDNQMLCQVIYAGFHIGELSCPTRYAPESSSISFRRSVQYGLGVLQTSVLTCGALHGVMKPQLFASTEAKHDPPSPQEVEIVKVA
ncbi:MAG: glycosyltransferase family 2 protein [Acidobacteria bacterium]|nr:glycosyltransferase family 2 protein [Acidobacteriota bacterium]MBI3426325.1 glycosyltransferase family 2 protein [Acidobacteriota bacterium]